MGFCRCLCAILNVHALTACLLKKHAVFIRRSYLRFLVHCFCIFFNHCTHNITKNVFLQILPSLLICMPSEVDVT